MITIHVNPITGAVFLQDPFRADLTRELSPGGLTAGMTHREGEHDLLCSMRISAEASGPKTVVTFNILHGEIKPAVNLGRLLPISAEPGATPVEEAAYDDPFIEVPEGDDPPGQIECREPVPMKTCPTCLGLGQSALGDDCPTCRRKREVPA